MEPRPFSVHVSDETLSDLHERLTRVRWPDEIPDTGWQYGTNLAYLRELVAYWRDTFDWRAQEAKLNQFQQFTVPVAGIELQFIHQPGVGRIRVIDRLMPALVPRTHAPGSLHPRSCFGLLLERL